MLPSPTASSHYLNLVDYLAMYTRRNLLFMSHAAVTFLHKYSILDLCLLDIDISASIPTIYACSAALMTVAFNLSSFKGYLWFDLNTYKTMRSCFVVFRNDRHCHIMEKSN